MDKKNLEPFDDSTEETEVIRRERLERPVALRLIVAGEGRYATHPLAVEGVVVIGRSEKADVCVEDPLMSRKHAALHIGDKLVLEDLRSANGVRFQERLLDGGERVEILPGQAFDMGGTTFVVQRALPMRRPRRMLTHGGFETRLEEEQARAERSRLAFAVLRVRVESGDDAAAQEVLNAELRAVDAIAQYAPREHEVLLVDTEPGRAREVAARLEARLAARGVGARIGVGCFPRDGTSPEDVLARACDALRPSDAGPESTPHVVQGGAMGQIDRLVQRIAVGNISVLILGETGVGKEVLAELIHERSPRRGKPFLRLNCAALPETLLMSELFGHERGAFTGAVQPKPGLLESADGGTVFLDEIGELPAAAQVQLLRVLEDRKVQRLGSLKARSIDVRFVGATNRDLESEIGVGRFRQDLYYRIGGVSIVIPPLRERTDEIEGLAGAFIAQYARAGGRRPPRLSPDALDVLLAYSWPGNIRELRNVMERAVLLTTGPEIGPEHLPLEKMHSTLLPRPRRTSSLDDAGGPASARGLPPPPREVPRPSTGSTSTIPPPARSKPGDDERARIIAALDRCAGNQTKAARVLGISRRTLVSRLALYGMPRPRKPSQT